MRVRSFTPLALLVEFLNQDFTKREQLKHGEISAAISLLIRTVNESKRDAKFGNMKRVQKEARSLLKNLFYHVRPAEQHEFVTKERLDLLIKKINKVGLKPKWEVAFGKEHFSIVNGDGRKMECKAFRSSNPFWQSPPQLGPSQKLVRFDGGKWIIYRRLYDETSVEKWVYGLIASALESGDFANLKVCPACQLFFVQRNCRQTYCQTSCKDDFHNKKRSEVGYFAANRKRKREKQIKQARKLLKDGATIAEIVERVRLSQRVLERGLIR